MPCRDTPTAQGSLGSSRRLFLPSAKTKTKRDREVPITKPLLAVLEMRKHGPDGTEHGPGAYVFGNSVGEVRKDIKTQWHRVLEAAKIVNFRVPRPPARGCVTLARKRSGPAPRDQRMARPLGHQTTSIYVRAKSTGRNARGRLEQFREEQE